MKQAIPTFGPIVTDTVAVAAALGIQPRDLVGGNLPVQVASSGLPFLYVALNSRAAVDAASIERGRILAKRERQLPHAGLNGFYLLRLINAKNNFHFASREG